MDLLLDAGNTRLKWGLHDEAGWHAQGAVLLTDRKSTRLNSSH